MRGKRSRNKFTRAQREACYALTLEAGSSYVRSARILSSAGYGRLAPFDISAASVARIADELRAQRTEAGLAVEMLAPFDAVDEMTLDAIRIARRQLVRLESRERNGTLKPAELRQWVALLRDLRALTRPTASGQVADKQAENAEPPPTITPDNLAWLRE